MFLSKIYYNKGISQKAIANQMLVSEAYVTKMFKSLNNKNLDSVEILFFYFD